MGGNKFHIVSHFAMIGILVSPAVCYSQKAPSKSAVSTKINMENIPDVSKWLRSLRLDSGTPVVLPDCSGNRGAPVRVRLSTVLEDLAHPRHSITRSIKRAKVGDDPDISSTKYDTPVEPPPSSSEIPFPTNLDMALVPPANKTGYTPIRIVISNSGGVRFMDQSVAMIPSPTSVAKFCGPVRVDTSNPKKSILKFGVIYAPNAAGSFNIGLLIPDWSGEDDPTDPTSSPSSWMPLYLDPAVKNNG